MISQEMKPFVFGCSATGDAGAIAGMGTATLSPDVFPLHAGDGGGLCSVGVFLMFAGQGTLVAQSACVTVKTYRLLAQIP